MSGFLLLVVVGVVAAAHGARGTKRTWGGSLTMSVVEGRTDMPFQRGDFRF
jgi:hypothetical protein